MEEAQTFEQMMAAGDELPAQAVPVELLQGCTVVNGNGEVIGEIEDLIVDLSSGRVSHAVFSSGDWLSSKSIAIPWKDVCFDSNTTCFVIKASEGFYQQEFVEH